MAQFNLIPYPQRLTTSSGTCTLAPSTTIRLLAGAGPDETFAAGILRDTLSNRIQLNPPFRASAAPPDHKGPDILFTQTKTENPEAYTLAVTPQNITISAGAAPGRFYGAQTLRQLILQFGGALPALTIEDAPDLRHRGVMLDLSRGKVPTLATLCALVERFAALKLNQLQLYIEHPFAFERHPLPSSGHSPLTADDVLALDAHCRRHHVALVPNLQSFGHVHETLIHERYRHLAESDFRGGWTLSPAVPEVYDFLAELYAEYLPLFSHRPYFNVDCDETWDLGKGKSKPDADARGIGRVYLDHLLKVRRLIEPYGCRMVCWGDILGKHPELIPELPRDVVPLDWAYDAYGQEKTYAEKCRPAQQAGLEHWTGPGTSAWQSFFFRKDNARDNIAGMAEAARASGATGMLNTDWGDAGHLNCISYSYWSFAWGADRSWRARPDEALAADPAAFDRRFMAAALPGAPEAWLKVLDLLGNQYLAFAPSNGKPALVHRALLSGKFLGREIEFFYGRKWPMPSPDELTAALAISEQALEILQSGAILKGELDLVRREWLAGAMLGAYACRRGLAAHSHPAAGTPESRKRMMVSSLNLLEDVWLTRNRLNDWPATRKEIEGSVV